jgi:glucose/arabinose dehydrogenase/mono/diheme cytochrome c family protein/lysophospholipase L1-like esterase
VINLFRQTLFFVALTSAVSAAELPILLKKDARIAIVGNGLGSRMMAFGHFETALHQRHPTLQLVVRNLCDEGNTPGFRPHSARPSPWAFPGAQAFHLPLSEAKDRWGSGHIGVGGFDSSDAWLKRIRPSLMIAFFGFNESFAGAAGVENFSNELTAFVKHTLAQPYNGDEPPTLALVSPIAFEDLSETHGTLNGQTLNGNLALYAAAIETVAAKESIAFINLLPVTQGWFDKTVAPLTIDGVQWNDVGYQRLAHELADQLFGKKPHTDSVSKIHDAVQEKNWIWHKHYKIPNGVHVHGRRHRPFGPENYPDELKKLEEMTEIRDRAIWAALEGKPFDLAAADAKTHPLPEIETNYKVSSKNGSKTYLYGEDALASLTVPEDYAINLFASERTFPDLANPVQMSFDNRGRLWIATMPTYPHYRPGDPKPNDKLIILEDTNSDGRADKQTIFADKLHLPTGFELSHDGVYVAQGTHLVHLSDRDGDDRADVRTIVMSGFDDHDTHHVISAFCADPSGALYMGEGTFLHSNVETAYGPVRSSNGGFFRYAPQRKHLERTARISIPNPWGTAFDDWGQPFFLDTSDPNLRWMLPATINVRYGDFAPNPPNLVEDKQRVRPTSGLEFVSSRHFPERVQGDILLNNTIGFLGTKQHTIDDDGTGYKSHHRQDLLTSTDTNFRPVDLEFAPDGSLYVLDWHNILVGHMQHSARDPLRDHVHGRVYRITYPSRPLVASAPIHKAPIATLLDNLKLPEARTRYRTRRELRGRAAQDVLPALRQWLNQFKASDAPVEHLRLEALWVTWGLDRVDESLLRSLLNSSVPAVRTAAVQVLRYHIHSISDHKDLLRKAVQDDHGRVRLAAITAASWLPPDEALPIIELASTQPIDDWIRPVYEAAIAQLSGKASPIASTLTYTTKLTGKARELYLKGAEVYHREGHCVTCHQENGLGLPAAQFPPIAGTKWVLGNEERLIKLTLNGLLGPIEVKGKAYPGQVPMTGFQALSDTEIAGVLTYVRNSFGNEAPPIDPEQVSRVREATKPESGFYSPSALLQEHPHD